MKKIRNNIFETNSSSTHSISIFTEEEYNKLAANELYITSKYDDTIISKEERDNIFIKEMKENNFNGTIEEYRSIEDVSELPMSLDEYLDSYHLETDENYYTSPSGDKLVIICQYGWG